jgi:hypothetical protein
MQNDQEADHWGSFGVPPRCRVSRLGFGPYEPYSLFAAILSDGVMTSRTTRNDGTEDCCGRGSRPKRRQLREGLWCVHEELVLMFVNAQPNLGVNKSRRFGSMKKKVATGGLCVWASKRVRSTRRFRIASSITTSYVVQADEGPHISAQHPRRSEMTNWGIAPTSGSKHNPVRRLLCPLASLRPNVFPTWERR